MKNIESFDPIIVEGGPAGSSCAAMLVDAGMRVAVLDRARFPRVKLCAGWLSAPIWEILESSPDSYPGSMWAWNRCHVYYAGDRHTSNIRRYFVRRHEFDDWLLTRSGAEVRQHAARRFTRDGQQWIVDDEFRARLSHHPLFSDYAFFYPLRAAASMLRSHSKPAKSRIPSPAVVRKLTHTAIASGFAWIFSGQAVPARPLRRLLGAA